MHGPKISSELAAVAVTCISAVAAATDLRWGKIYNWLTIPAWLAGFALLFQMQGLAGVESAFMGTLLAAALMLPFYALGVMGAGDVKLFMAIGAWGGPGYAASTVILSVALGGLLAVGMLAAKGRLGGFAARVQLFLSGLRSRETRAPLALDRTLKMPFGVPIAAAAIWLAWDDAFARMGVTLW